MEVLDLDHGEGLAGRALLSAIIFLVMRLRRSREVSPVSQPLSPNSDAHQGYPVGMAEVGNGSNSMSPMTGTVSEMESNGARPWSLRSELDTTGSGASPPLGFYSDSNQHMQPQNLSPSQTFYDNSFGMQHSQQWMPPYPPDVYSEQAGATELPETQPAGRHGGPRYLHELG